MCVFWAFLSFHTRQRPPKKSSRCHLWVFAVVGAAKNNCWPDFPFFGGGISVVCSEPTLYFPQKSSPSFIFIFLGIGEQKCLLISLFEHPLPLIVEIGEDDTSPFTSLEFLLRIYGPIANTLHCPATPQSLVRRKCVSKNEQ